MAKPNRFVPSNTYDHARIVALAQKGVSTPRIAERIGCHPRTVNRVIRQHGDRQAREMQ